MNLDLCYAIDLNFYRVFHASRFRGEHLQLLLHCELPASELREINARFQDLLLGGTITSLLCQDESGRSRHCLEFWFDQTKVGRLYALIQYLNNLALPAMGRQEPPLSSLGQAA